MAGDWIKMQGNLWTSPKVVRLMSATNADKCRVIGALFRYWCLFDEHTEDGLLQGYTKFLIDDELRIDGFADALEDIDWLIVVDGVGLQVPDFDDHMSKSAKRRAQETKRKREGRKTSASDADKNRSREEKRREDKDIGGKSKKFTPPKVSEVAEYIKEKSLSVDANAFVDHFSSNGWKVGGKAVMKDWKAAVRNWARRNAPEKPKGERW